MNKYFCVFRMLNAAKSMSCSFEAENGAKAIEKMMTIANITSTMELDEAELMQVVRTNEGKIGYKPVLRKDVGQKGKITIPSAPIPETPKALPIEVVAYKSPYTIEVL
jgi:hypothetical protein